MNEQHILIALCGTSPAVLTETIWAMAMESIHDPSSAELPHRIIVLTTTLGAQSISQQLLENREPGSEPVWTHLRNTLKQAGFPIEDRLIFGDTSEHLRRFSLPCPHTGLATALDDIRTKEEQTATADYILETLRSFTETPNTKVSASLAGGRKTMSSLLYGCMTLVGRRDDRLTHVLVSEPYDNPGLTPRFYYPEQQQQTLSLPNADQLIQANKAIIELMDVPFVPVRYAFEKQLGNTPSGFHELVAIYTGNAITSDIDVRLTLSPSNCSITYGAAQNRLSSREFTLFHFLAHRAKENRPAYPDYKSGIDDIGLHIKKLKASAPAGNLAHIYHDLPTNLDHEDIRKIIDAIKRKIKMHGPSLLPLIQSLPEKGRLSLNYPPKLIQIEQ